MKSLLLAFFLFVVAGCTPDGVRVDGDYARVVGFAELDIENRDFNPESPDLEKRKWLYTNNFEYQYFEPDTTLGVIGTSTSGKNIFVGDLVYRK